MGNSQVVKSSVKNTLITDENIQAALKNAEGSDAQLISWSLQDFPTKGDNYTHIVTSVEVKYHLNDVESTNSFIAKLGIPQPTVALHDSIHFAFVKETEVYQELIPLLNTEMTSLGLKPLRVPKCYYAACGPEKEVIYLQDLRCCGFQIYSRQKVFDRAHTTLVLKELAKLHASSLLLQVTDGYEDLEAKFSILHKDCFDITKETIQLSKIILNRYIEKTLAVLRDIGNYEKAVDWLESLKPRAFELMMKQLNYNTRFAVVCHGDCWNNNMLFRYDAIGNPAEVMLINLDLFRQASLAIDLKMFFYHSLAYHDREANLEYYLDTYYASFKNVMEAGGLAMPFTREELVDEYESKHLYACFWAMAYLPTLVNANEDIQNESPSSQSAESSETEKNLDSSQNIAAHTIWETPLTQERKDNFVRKFKKNPDIMARFLSLFDRIEEEESEDV
ncbi:uncharacterized protein [Macrobrachium rosenbergii]|uniref:uncharacterized protein n=1 Tax=Macrobrachium rosenbergii TaxID=79674 RepID=UPI0034D77225